MLFQSEFFDDISQVFANLAARSGIALSDEAFLDGFAQFQPLIRVTEKFNKFSFERFVNHQAKFFFCHLRYQFSHSSPHKQYSTSRQLYPQAASKSFPLFLSNTEHGRTRERRACPLPALSNRQGASRAEVVRGFRFREIWLLHRFALYSPQDTTAVSRCRSPVS